MAYQIQIIIHKFMSNDFPEMSAENLKWFKTLDNMEKGISHQNDYNFYNYNNSQNNNKIVRENDNILIDYVKDIYTNTRNFVFNFFS